uniref:Uncharacterized protein n=1 Tax=Avena sativa TaxID=4498 RepID=A0ACD5T957_AVESA
MADVWSCGVTLYVMLVGAYPFEDQDDPKNIKKTIQRIAAVDYKIPDNIHISYECRQLISLIFTSNPMKRIKMKEIKSHPWFLKNLPGELTEQAQSSYYKKSSGMPSFSKQTNLEIMRIVEEAKRGPRSTGTGYGYGDEGYGEEEKKEETNEPEQNDEEDECDKQVREVLESRELDMSSLRIE